MTTAVYIMASGRRGTLYIGSTANLLRRVWEHREGAGRFTARYAVRNLVWYEVHEHVVEARRREYRIKRYKRDWKIRLIEEDNPGWADLFEGLGPG